MGPLSASARLATAGVILIGLGTSTLVYLAVTRPSADSHTALAVPTSSVGDEPTDDVLSPGDGSTATAAPTFGTVLLDAPSATVAWRVTNDPAASSGSPSGACNGFRHPSSASMTGDGGATWTGVELPFQRVVQVRAAGADAVSVVGSDGDCTAGYASSDDGGATWTKGPVPTDIWYVDAADFTAIRIGAASSRPCPGRVLQLSAQSPTRAAVLCDDTTVHATANAGRTWSVTTSAPGTVAIADDGDQWLAAVRGVSGCTGLAVQVVGDAAPSGCAHIGASGAATLDVPDGITVWMATPATSAVSSDSGVTWPY